MATRPDFARTDLSALGREDLAFLLERFPRAGESYPEIAGVIAAFPNTLETMLESEFVTRAVLGRRGELLRVSPFLLFNVLLRRTLADHRGRRERRVVNYLANLLALFVRSDRLYRIAPGDSEPHRYIVELLEDAAEADSRRRFLVHAHVGNYALFLTGLFPRWIEHRHHYRRRPVDLGFYMDFGRAYYQAAARHPLAREYRLEDVFFRLALLFDQYVSALNRMSRQYLALG